MSVYLRELKATDISALTDHQSRHFSEPGYGGLPAHPYSAENPFQPNDYAKRVLKRWETPPPTHGSWEKSWGLFEGELIVGHIELVGPGRPFLAHRAKLGMGIEIPYRQRGHGRQMLETVITWARSTDYLDWIDLDVFAHNEAARRLYKQFGFTVTGVTPDRLRVKGQPIDDVQMALALRA